MSKETILVVDDNREITDYLAGELLPSMGYQTLVAHSGKSALRLVRAQQPDLMLLDFELSDTTGLEVLRQLASENYSVPAILITAHGSEQIAADAFRLGVQDYLPKPVDVQSLNTAVTRALAESRLRREKAELTAQLKQQVAWMTVLSRIGRSVTSTLELSEVLRRIVEASVYLAQAEEGFLALLDDATGQLYLRAVRNLDQDDSKTLRLRVSDPLVTKVISTGRPVRLTRTTEGEPLKVSTGLLVRSLLHVPILSKGKVLGVLSVDNRINRRAFVEMDETLLTSLADYAAIAIENARLYEDLQTQVTFLREAQTRLVQSEKLAAVGELVAGVAHELNNPLTSIIGFAHMLRRSDLNDQSLHDLDRILAQAQRAARIVRGLLDFARQHPPERKPVQINTVLTSVLELLAYELRTHNVEWTTHLSPNLPLTMADPYQLQQVFISLINNARQAMSEARGGGHLSVTTGFGSSSLVNQQVGKEPAIRVIIKDDGVGVPADVLPRIFDPFFTTKPVGEGTGLGLSICYGIVSEHDGYIWAESEPGQGTTFFVELPVVAPEVLRRACSLNGEDRPETVQSSLTSNGKAHILVIDDERDLLDIVTRALQGSGYRVDAASDGKAALARLVETNYDLVVCDVRMPGISGPEIYQQLQAKGSSLAGRFIFITGDSVSPATRRFLDETGVSYLCKPFEPTDLVETLREALESRHDSEISAARIALPHLR